MGYDRARKNLDRHPNYILAAYMASGTWPRPAAPHHHDPTSGFDASMSTRR